MSLCGKCGHDNDPGKDFCSQCGEFLGWGEDSPAPPRSAALPPPTRPAVASPVRPAPALAVVAVDPALRQAQEEARVAEEEAGRVRAEAEGRARAATETARQRATEEAREARLAAAARMRKVVDTATRTAGGSKAEIAALVSRVRLEAEATARSEVEDAELRAARRARRAREEAHVRAQAEAAEAERRAAQAAQRASALIARTSPRPADPAVGDQAGQRPRPTPDGTDTFDLGQQTIPAQPVQPTHPARPTDPTQQVQAVQPARAVLPGAPQWRPPPQQAPQTGAPPDPSGVACGQCATANEPSRRFCRKCGESLLPVPVPPHVGWLRRSWGWLRSRLNRDPANAHANGHEEGASSTGRAACSEHTGPGLSTANLTRGALVVLAAVGMVAALGPYRQQAGARLTSLRRHIVPKPSYIYGEVASGGTKGACAACLTDKLLTPVEFASTQLSADPPSPGSPPAFSVSLGTDGDLTKPVNVFKVGIVGGALGDQQPTHPSPHHVMLVAYGKDGNEEKSATLSLHDDASFQSFLFVASHVLRVDFYVLDTYNTPQRQGPYAVDEVEFFALT